MSTVWPRVRLGDILRFTPRPVTVESTRTYREIGIRSHGRGIFHKPPVTGLDLGNKKVFYIEPDDFVLNIVFAWEGAVAVTSEAEAGMIASHRFPTFRPDPARLELKYLLHWCQTELGRNLLDRVSPGGAGRNRTLNRDAFLNQDIPLPPLAKQRQVVARIDELAAQVNDASTLRQQAVTQTLAFDAAVDPFPSPSSNVVGDFITFQTGYAFKSEWFSDAGIRLARNANVGHGRLEWSETVRIPEERRREFSRFELRAADILISLDRPIISTGVKIAQVYEDDLPCLLLQRVARATFRGDKVLPEYFFRWLQSPHFVRAIDPGRSNGVPHISHKEIEAIRFPAPPISEQRRIVVELDTLRVQTDELKRLQIETAAGLDALLPAILNRAFKGQL